MLARIRTSAWCTLYSHLPAVNDTRFRGQDKITPGLPATLPRVLVHLLVSGTVDATTAKCNERLLSCAEQYCSNFTTRLNENTVNVHFEVSCS